MASEDSIDRRNAIAAAAALAKKNAAIDAANKAKGLAKTGERDAADTAARAAADKAAADKVIADAAAAKAAAEKAAAEAQTEADRVAAATAEAARIATLKGKPPGKAWLWDDATNNWVQPPKPTDGKTYVFNNDTGWTVNAGTGNTVADPTRTFIEWEYNKDFSQRRARYKDSTGKDIYDEWTISPRTKEEYDTAAAKIAGEETVANEKRDIFKTIEQTMISYGFTPSEYTELSKYIQEGLINPKMGPNQMLLELRQLPVYQARFAGNQTLLKNNKNALSEANYLLQETAYAATLKQYGLENLSSRSQFAEFIGNSVSNLEVGRRADIAINRVKNVDPAIEAQLRAYYPGITDKDIVSYFLNPAETLPLLEKKINTAEIGAAASSFGLGIDEQRANMFSGLGITQATAQEGYKNIAQEILPISKKLSDVYKEEKINYDQKTAEQEQFNLVGGTEAANQRKLLQSKERASFSASAGNAPGAYSTGYLKKTNSAGQI